MKDLFPMKVITHTITHTAKFAGRYIESKMYPAKFAGGRSRLDLLLPSFLPSREEKKMQDRIFCPLRGHAVGRMQYAPTTCRQEEMFQIILLARKEEQKIQDRKNHPLGSRGVLNTPHTDRVRTEMKMQDRIFCPLRGHAVGRMQYAPTSYRQETLFPINSLEERTETNKQDSIFCPLRGHAVGRMQYAPTTCRQESMFQIILLAGKDEKKIQDQKNRPLGCRGVLHTPPIYPEMNEKKKQEQKNHPLGCRGVLHTPYMDRVRIEKKKQDRIFCPLRGHAMGRMQYAPTSCRQESMFQINSLEERTETKMQERRKQSIDSGAEWHTPFMRQGKRDAVWRDTFLEQRARVAIWRDRRLEEKYSHARFQLSTFGENSKPYKSSLVALSEQLRDIFAA